MNNNYKSVLDLIGDIYESSINPYHWSVVLEKLTAITQSRSAVLVIHDREVKQLSYLHSYGIRKPVIALHNTPLGRFDPGLKVMRAQPQGKAVNMYSLDDRDKVPRLIYELFTRLTELFHFGGVNCFNNEHWHAGIGLHRTRKEGKFEPEILELLENLVPHFQRALRIQKEFTRLQIRQQTLQSELDRHIIGLILLDELGKPLYINPMAKRILERHGAIDLRSNGLRAYIKHEDEQLHQAIMRATATSPGTIYQGQSMGLSHPDHHKPLALLVVPSAANQSAEWSSMSHSQVAVYLTDPEEPVPIAHDALMDIYGLSEREAKVAVAIANGREVSEIADMHHVSVQTVRSHLKSIFSKTGVNRQVDLIRLLLGGPMMYGA